LTFGAVGQLNLITIIPLINKRPSARLYLDWSFDSTVTELVPELLRSIKGRAFICLFEKMLYFNAQHGFVEGLIRGLRVGLLNSQNYLNLTQCETLGIIPYCTSLLILLEDLKLQLSATEYGNFLANIPSPITTSTISDKATEKLVEEFNYLRAQAVGDFAKFFDYITYSYQIDNVVLLITGTLHERDTHELLERCHPLGWFNSLPALCVATTVEELYNSVLIETPLGTTHFYLSFLL
jgi:V-type H+-transporting ATPase subunit d